MIRSKFVRIAGALKVSVIAPNDKQIVLYIVWVILPEKVIGGNGVRAHNPNL